MSVYLTADLHLNDPKHSEKYGMSSGEYNGLIIKNWNSIIKPEDKILIMGEIGNSNMKTIRAILTQLKGEKILIDYSLNNKEKKQMWNWAGIQKVWDMSIHYDTNFNGEDCIVWIKNSKSENLGKNEYVCCGENVSKEIFNGKEFNVSIANWDFFPIEMQMALNTMEEYLSVKEEIE